MQVLFVHQGFPGQYRHLAAALRARGDQVVAIGGPRAPGLAGIPLHRYDPSPLAGVPDCHPWARDFQVKCLRAEAVARLLEQLMANGLCPDLVVGHPGWGELLAVKDLLPHIPVLHHVEFVYPLAGGDVGFDAEFERNDWHDRSRLRLKRAPQLLAFHDLDWGLAPTQWQASTAPQQFRDRISVIHEGIDTNAVAPMPGASITLQKAAITFQSGDPVVTFVARNLEPYRGFHQFMRMLPQLHALCPSAHVVIVGGDGVSYGRAPQQGGSWKQLLLQELGSKLELSHVHFVGRIPNGVLHQLFSVSACHVYLTYPFVLSWSLLESMACEAVVVASDTAPVREVIEPGSNGLLVDFFDGDAIAGKVADVLADPARYRHLGLAARRTVVSNYDLRRVCLPRQLALVDQLAAGAQLNTPGCR